jgi:hypothetical protein
VRHLQLRRFIAAPLEVVSRSFCLQFPLLFAFAALSIGKFKII